MKGDFNLLSVGKRCQDHGMDFVWLGSRKMLPYFICKNGTAVVMRVDYNIPYIDSAGNRGVRPRGILSKTVRLPLPPSKPGGYTASSATAAGITTIALTSAATMTTRVKLHDAATQTEFAPQSSCPAQVAEVQDPAATLDGIDSRQVLLRAAKPGGPIPSNQQTPHLTALALRATAAQWI